MALLSAPSFATSDENQLQESFKGKVYFVMRRNIALKLTALIIFIVITSLSSTIPTQAATGIISHSAAGDYAGPTCETSFVGFNYSITGTVNDGGGIDNVIAVARDGHWNYLQNDFGYFPVGQTHTNVFFVP